MSPANTELGLGLEEMKLPEITGGIPADIGEASFAGTQAILARADHTHRGLSSLTGGGETLYGDVTLTAGTAFLMWMGNQITDKGIGILQEYLFTVPLVSNKINNIRYAWKADTAFHIKSQRVYLLLDLIHISYLQFRAIVIAEGAGII